MPYWLANYWEFFPTATICRYLLYRYCTLIRCTTCAAYCTIPLLTSYPIYFFQSCKYDLICFICSTEKSGGTSVARHLPPCLRFVLPPMLVALQYNVSIIISLCHRNKVQLRYKMSRSPMSVDYSGLNESLVLTTHYHRKLPAD